MSGLRRLTVGTNVQTPGKFMQPDILLHLTSRTWTNGGYAMRTNDEDNHTSTGMSLTLCHHDSLRLVIGFSGV